MQTEQKRKCNYTHTCSTFHKLAISLTIYHFAMRRKTIISKWTLLKEVRRGENTLPPKENSLSHAALAGNPVLKTTYIFLMCGYASRDSKLSAESARYLSTSSETLSFSPSLSCLLVARLAKKLEFTESETAEVLGWLSDVKERLSNGCMHLLSICTRRVFSFSSSNQSSLNFGWTTAANCASLFCHISPNLRSIPACRACINFQHYIFSVTVELCPEMQFFHLLCFMHCYVNQTPGSALMLTNFSAIRITIGL